MFRTVPLSIIRSFTLYTQQWYMSYRSASRIRMELVPSWSWSQAICKSVWHIPLLYVQWKTPDDGQRNCLKHVEFHSNKLKKLMHLFGFIIQKFSIMSHSMPMDSLYFMITILPTHTTPKRYLSLQCNTQELSSHLQFPSKLYKCSTYHTHLTKTEGGVKFIKFFIM
jgi:hypothetical protein